MTKPQVEKRKELERLHQQERKIIERTTIIYMTLMLIFKEICLATKIEHFRMIGISAIFAFMTTYYICMFHNYFSFKRKRNKVLNTDKVEK